MGSKREPTLRPPNGFGDYSGRLGLIVLGHKSIQYVLSLADQAFSILLETTIRCTGSDNRATRFQFGNLLYAISDVPQPLEHRCFLVGHAPLRFRLLRNT